MSEPSSNRPGAAPTSAVSAAAGEEYRRRIIESPSYGAAFFNWIYLVAMRAWGHALLAFVFGMIFLPMIWIVWLVYGLFGQRIAWKTRRWRDFDDFLACQRAWTRAAVVCTIVIAVIVLAGMILAMTVPFVLPRRQYHPSI
jgi:hypothetical protein